MKLFGLIGVAIFTVGIFAQGSGAASKCDGINRRITAPPDWNALSSLIQKQLESAPPHHLRHHHTVSPPEDLIQIKFLRSLASGEWLIVQVDLAHGPPYSFSGDDPPFYFFRGYLSKTRFVRMAEGVGPGMLDDDDREKLGVPDELARCFVWSVGHW